MTIDPQWDFDALPMETISVQDNLAGGESTNAMVAKVLAESAGDVPTMAPPEDPLVTLPGGLYWEGNLLRTAEVRELTGEDEEALSAVKGSMARWMSVMLERAVVRVGDLPITPAAAPSVMRALLIGDRDALLLGIRVATFGPEITLQNILCPHCEAAFDATVDLTTVDTVTLDTPAPGHEYTVPLRWGGMATVRLPDGAAQEATFDDANSTPAQRNTRLLARCLTSVRTADGHVRTESGEALARGLSMADRQLVLRYLADNQPGPRLDDITFDHACGEEVRLPITLPELFRI